MYLVVMYIVPFTCLAAFNLRIYQQIRKANAERSQLSRLQQREIRMATMLMIVVIVFFICNILALVVNVLEVMSIETTALTKISNLLVTFNSSVNFIIYCIFGEKFKRLFCHLFCGRKYCCFGPYANKEGFPLLHRYTTNNATIVGGRSVAGARAGSISFAETSRVVGEGSGRVRRNLGDDEELDVAGRRGASKRSRFLRHNKFSKVISRCAIFQS